MVGQSTAHPEGETLSAYVDSELDRPTHERVERHLQVCRQCADVVADYRRSSALIKRLPRPDLPASFSGELSYYPAHVDRPDRPAR